jgi:hypothetical protein
MDISEYEYIKNGKCPECHEKLEHVGKCHVCHHCGWGGCS